MRSDFDDFRAAFFDLAFSIATLYRRWGSFSIRDYYGDGKKIARQDTKACA